jgi:PLP dependent protein
MQGARVMSGSNEALAERFAQLEARIAKACRACGRDRSRVQLIAVSKRHPASAIEALYALGQRSFGENYAQEFEEKALALAHLPELVWHFIGHLQTNKARRVVRFAHWIHTVDSERLLSEVERVATLEGRAVRTLLEVNTGAEAQKYGCLPSAAPALIGLAKQQTAQTLVGLMTMPPADERAAAAFAELAALATEHHLPELSMGMSNDLELAIAAGATMIRVGTALFGERT